MGMAASQARFLTLTARKSNTEYQGQQVNQQRTALANESANIYSKLSNMDVPTAPSKTAYNGDRYTLTNPNGEKYTLTDIQVTEKPSTENGNKATAIVKVSYNELTPSAGAYTFGEVSSSADLSSGLISRRYNGTTTNFTATNCVEKGWSVPQEIKDKSGITEDSGWYQLQQKYSDGTVSDKVYYMHESELNLAKDPDSKYDLQYYTEEKKSAPATKEVSVELEQNAVGRYTKARFTGENLGFGDKELDLGYEYGTDEEAYEKAFKDYEYKKALYEKEVDKLNAETEIIQNQDKRLELKLKQLDTDRNAINTEMEAVKGYLKKNVEGTFNTFG